MPPEPPPAASRPEMTVRLQAPRPDVEQPGKEGTRGVGDGVLTMPSRQSTLMWSRQHWLSSSSASRASLKWLPRDLRLEVWLPLQGLWRPSSLIPENLNPS